MRLCETGSILKGPLTPAGWAREDVGLGVSDATLRDWSILKGPLAPAGWAREDVSLGASDATLRDGRDGVSE